MLGILGDVVVEFEHVALRSEGADPFVRGDEHVRPLADTEDLEELQGVVVESLGRAFAHHHLDALVGALCLERLVQPVGRLHHIARTQRPGWVLPRPEFELHGLLRQCRRGRDHRGSRASHQRCSHQRQSSGIPVSHGDLPHSCDARHRTVVFDCGAAQRNNAPISGQFPWRLRRWRNRKEVPALP